MFENSIWLIKMPKNVMNDSKIVLYPGQFLHKTI